MGQTSLPILNRTGHNLFWDKSWDNKFNYQYFLIKFLYIELFLFKFFKNKFFKKKFLRFKKNKGKSTDFKGLYFFKNFFYKASNNFDFIESVDKEICTSKVWIFKYQGWLVFIIYIYFPSIFFKKSLFEGDLNLQSNQDIIINRLNIGKSKLDFISTFKWPKRKIRYITYKKKLYYTSKYFLRNSLVNKPFLKISNIKRLQIANKFLKKKKIPLPLQNI